MTISTVLRKPPVILAAGTLLVALMVFFRIHALYPTVFGDEWTYSRMSRLEPLSRAAIPSFLYLSLYRLTNFCGDGFLSCARLMNVAFFFSAIPFIYLIARKVATPALAVWIALLVAIDPMNSYTAYFMPEAMFFFVFWLFAWSVLRLDAAHKSVDLIVPAVLFGFLALVKPHPIFMYPALIVYLGYMSRQATYAAWLRLWAMRSAIFVGVSLLAKLAISSIFAGKAGLTLFGGFYGSIVTHANGPERYVELALKSATSLSGHLMILSILFGTAICAMFYAAAKALSEKDDRDGSRRIAIFSFLVIGSMVGLSAIFTAAIAGLGPSESLARVHMRYYNFALPLLLILAGAGITDHSRRRLNIGVTIAVAIAALTAYAIATRISGAIPTWVDAPEATAASDLPSRFYLLAVFGLLATVVWAFNQRAGSRIFLLAFAPVMIVLNLYAVNEFAQRFEKPDVYDRAGIVAHQLFPPSERSNIILYGPDTGYLTKVLFHIDSPLPKSVGTSPASPPDLSSIRNSQKIAIVFEPNTGAPSGVTEIHADGYSIFRSAVRPELDLDLDFTKPIQSPGLASATGISVPEHWGAWSEGALVTLKFRKNLPESLRVHLRAKAFGPNVGKPFTMRVGDQTRDFSLTDVPRNIELKFGNPGASDTITIAVPQPASPHETGVGGDPRKLGIAMIEFRIEKLDGSGNQNTSQETAVSAHAAAETTDTFWRQTMGLGSVLNLIKYRNVVDELYRGLLGREADADGRAHHLNLLRSGVPLSQLISGLVSSDEFRQKNPKSGEEEPEGCSKAEAIAMFAKFEDPDRKPREGFTTNFMGGVVAVNVIDMLGGRSGFVEGYPIPANIQGRTIEWMGTLQSVLDARGSYSIVELGAGWAPWCAAGYVAAKKMGITDISVVAVEGDKGKIAFIRDNFAAHGIEEKATTITYGVVGPFDGFAEFPDLSVDPNINYGLAADFNAAKKDVKMLKVPAFSLKTILAPFDRVDLIHCDVQGAEADVFEAGMDVALAKVKRVVIGTHSLDIEKRLIGIFKGWVCEGMTSGEYIVPSILTRDGCQIWRNPNLTS